MTSFAAGARRCPPLAASPRHHPRPLARRGLDRDGVCPAAGQLELPHPSPDRRGPARRRGGALRRPAARRGRPHRPAALGERVSFMAPFALTRTMAHPYTEFYPETHGHFAPTRFVQPAYSAACVPFRWVLREKVEASAKDGEIGIAERLKIGWAPDREPDIRNHQDEQVETAWVQERENQLALLDTFFGAVRPEESLCFFYAKRTPLSEQPTPSRRGSADRCRHASIRARPRGPRLGRTRPSAHAERHGRRTVRPQPPHGLVRPERHGRRTVRPQPPHGLVRPDSMPSAGAGGSRPAGDLQRGRRLAGLARGSPAAAGDRVVSSLSPSCKGGGGGTVSMPRTTRAAERGRPKGTGGRLPPPWRSR